MNLEIVAIARVESPRYFRLGIGDRMAVPVENDQPSETGGGGGLIEQDLLPAFGRQGPDFEVAIPLRDSSQRQVVEFDIARDGAFHKRADVANERFGRLQIGVVRFIEDAGEEQPDRDEAQQQDRCEEPSQPPNRKGALACSIKEITDKITHLQSSPDR